MTYPTRSPVLAVRQFNPRRIIFFVGNQCCAGNVWKDVDATVRVFLDYSQAMANVPGGNTISTVTLAVTPIGGANPLVVFSPSMSGNTKAFLVSGGVVGGNIISRR